MPGEGECPLKSYPRTGRRGAESRGGRRGGSPRRRVAQRLTPEDLLVCRLESLSLSARGSVAAGGKFSAGLRRGGAGAGRGCGGPACNLFHAAVLSGRLLTERDGVGVFNGHSLVSGEICLSCVSLGKENKQQNFTGQERIAVHLKLQYVFCVT